MVNMNVDLESDEDAYNNNTVIHNANDIQEQGRDICLDTQHRRISRRKENKDHVQFISFISHVSRVFGHIDRQWVFNL